MNILYLTWGETPRSYGVFGSQVIQQFVETSRLSPSNKYFFLSAIPLIHSGLFREKLNYIQEIKKVNSMLGFIDFILLPIFASQNFVNSSKFTFSFMHGISHYLLYRKLSKLKLDIVHCRSYHAAWAALSVKNKYKLNFKIIFDGRGTWPEEVALKNKWDSKSSNYLYLKYIEKILLENCDSSVSVSATMHNHYIDLGAKNDNCIFLSSDITFLKVDLESVIKTKKVRFCYVGALDEGTWHKPSSIAQLYSKLRKSFPSTELTIVTTSSHDKIKTFFKKFPESEIIFISTRTRQELGDVLSRQDFGLLTYFQPMLAMEISLGNMVLAVKTAEYLTAGLPIICNSYCGGAAKLIKDNKLGVCYHPEKIDDIKPSDISDLTGFTIRKRCQDFAIENFDYKVNAKKYLKLYSDVVSNNKVIN